MRRALDVGVIGCGTAGSAAAVFLARAGHRVTVYERVASPGPVGAGITLQPTGLHVLSRLDLYDEVVARGARLDRLLCETKARKPIVDLTYTSVGEDLFGLGLHRGVLFEALLGAALREPRILIRTGIEVVDLARADRAGRDGPASWLVDAAGRRHGPHELVVVADGARSQLRDDTSTSKSVVPYPWGALWFVGEDARPEGDPGVRTLLQVADTNQRLLGLLPTGRRPSSEARDGGPRLVSLFWSIRADRVASFRERGLDRWKEEVARLAPEAAQVLDQIDDPAKVLYAGYHDVVMHRWHTRSVVYLGDAAHATSPQLGQGCNLALWDAMELADAVDAEPRHVAQALERYSRRRRDHLAFYQLATRWLTPFFQGDQPSLGAVRDVAMPLLARVSIFRRLMTLSMLGVIEGFSGRTLELRLPVG